MYVTGNPKTKKQVKEWLAEGREVTIFSPGSFPAKSDGREFVEGPHYPQPHKWYGQVEMKDGKVVSIK